MSKNNQGNTPSAKQIKIDLSFDGLTINKKGTRYDSEKECQYETGDSVTLQGNVTLSIDAAEFVEAIYSNHGFTDCVKEMARAVTAKLRC